jgi:uncharacterized protein (TIGR02058 family)
MLSIIQEAAIMALNRYVTEMGMGADVHGRDYTKAAKRAVSDAIRHSSLNFFRALGKSPDDMKITVRIGVAEPNEVDTQSVAAELPYGSVSVECVVGAWMYQRIVVTPRRRPWAMPSSWPTPP